MPAKGGAKAAPKKDSTPKAPKAKKGSEKKDEEPAAPAVAAAEPTPVAAPKAEAPKAEAPKAEAPKTEAPKTEEPKVAVKKVEPAKVEAKSDSTVKHPLCKWAESSEAVFLTIEVNDCKNPSISITETEITFECNGYKADLKLKKGD